MRFILVTCLFLSACESKEVKKIKEVEYIKDSVSSSDTADSIYYVDSSDMQEDILEEEDFSPTKRTDAYIHIERNDSIIIEQIE